MTNEIKNKIKWEVRIGNVTKDVIEKSINRNAKKVGKQINRAGYALLTEMGFGYTPFCHSKDDSVEGILHRNNQEWYPKPTPKYKPELPPALSLDI